MRNIRSTCLLLLSAISVSCGSDSHAQYQTEVAFDNLTFTRPVDLQAARDGSGRLFVVEQAGVIRVFAADPATDDAPTFLDIRSRVDDSGNEEGLLGLAFHPDYATNGYFYVNYTASGPNRTVVSRFSVSATDPDVADASSELVLLSVPQPYSNHNGGQVQFGPDGMLYIALGDGGSGGDPDGNGQDRTTLLGSILRIDVNQSGDGRNYGIPPDNPFVSSGEGWAEEIYAYGLRNPWRFSFDSETGDLWAADVGQNAFEEIDIVESGANYGWNVMEAYSCYNASSCNQTGLALPVYAYPHDSGDRSVTGGYVYRGTSLPSLAGKYVYADFVSGRIWALSESQGEHTNELLVDTSFGVASFGVDENGELYVCGFDGRIHTISLESTSTEGSSGPTGALLAPPYPNPSSGSFQIPIELAAAAAGRVTVHDVLGRRVADLFSGLIPAGRHILTWTPRRGNGSAGLYWIHVFTESEGISSRALVYRP